jgi:hypothetical protein
MRFSRLSRVFLSGALTLTMASAALAQKVTTDYDKAANFSQYKTFSWIKEPNTTNPLMRQRVIEEINAALAAKGLQLVSSGGDIAIASHAATKEQHTLNTFYDGFGGGWGWRRFGGGFGSATTMVSTYQVGTLVVDMFDGKSKEAIWRGTATKTLSDNPEKNSKSLHEAIAKMFKKFPPAGKNT